MREGRQRVLRDDAVAAEGDEALMQALSDGGDTRALDLLMERWRRPLQTFLIRYTGNETDARELAQESFVRVFLRRGDYRPGARFSTWLFQIAINLARDLARKKNRRKTDFWADQTVVEAQGLAGNGDTPVEAVRREEERQAVRAALAALPEESRALIVLSEYEERSHAEIAELLGVTAKAVETRLARVRGRLRVMLRPWIEGRG